MYADPEKGLYVYTVVMGTDLIKAPTKAPDPGQTFTGGGGGGVLLDPVKGLSALRTVIWLATAPHRHICHAHVNC